MKALNVSRIPAFEDNYIWLIHSNNQANEKHIIIVDPGDETPVFEAIKEHHLIPQAIFITHHHADHCGGVKGLLEFYDIPVYGPTNEEINLLSMHCKQGDIITFDEMDLSFSVMDVPGHTKGHIAYFGQQSLFIGDTLFAGGCGRVFEGTFKQMQQSLDSLLGLDDQILVYCAHEYTQDNLKFAVIAEPENQALLQRIKETDILRSKNQPTVPSLLKLEKETNPFLRFNQPSIISAAEKYCGHLLTNPIDTFTIIRQWKDALDN
ncbi:MAG: hydroxyacylglutathione hydrolase [Pseudomonadota bacterium]